MAGLNSGHFSFLIKHRKKQNISGQESQRNCLVASLPDNEANTMPGSGKARVIPPAVNSWQLLLPLKLPFNLQESYSNLIVNLVSYYAGLIRLKSHDDCHHWSYL